MYNWNRENTSLRTVLSTLAASVGLDKEQDTEMLAMPWHLFPAQAFQVTQLS